MFGYPTGFSNSSAERQRHMKFKKHVVHLHRLLLDPNNYRFHDLPRYREVRLKSRYSEPGVQSRAQNLLEDSPAFDLGSLKDSIRTNGYIPIEQIVVVPFETISDANHLFLVIEGNRRTAAVKSLLKENEEGSVDLTDVIKSSMKKIEVVELLGADAEIATYTRTLMAIRHVSGVRQWGPYQQAKLVVELFELEGATLGSVAQKIGITSREVARRYRASKALAQMEEDEEFSDFAEPRLYAFFHEAVSSPTIREWLGFSDETYTSTNDDARRLFFELLSPREIDGNIRPAKLTNANQQVRQLRDIVGKAKAVDVLADPEATFEDAHKAALSEIVESEEGIVQSSLAQAITALKKPGLAYSDAEEKELKLWADLLEVIKKIKRIIRES